MCTYKEKNFISVVIYIYNDEKNIFHFLEQLDSVFADQFEKYEFRNPVSFKYELSSRPGAVHECRRGFSHWRFCI